jgi:hypothetical protein
MPVLVVAAAVAACSRSAITPPRLEAAVAHSFANLVAVQQPILGGPAIAAAQLGAAARCGRVGLAADGVDAGPGSGAGDWRCTIRWFVPGRADPMLDTYDVAVTAEGCYTATADGAEAHVGGPKLKTIDGSRTVTNLLYAFDGCFDLR